MSKAPQFFSRTGSFGFDAEWSAQEILAAVNRKRSTEGLRPLDELGETPVLRMARQMDEQHEYSRDPILRSLMEWASTVVRLPLLPGAAERLAEDIQQTSRSRSEAPSNGREFPNLFQLFSPHVGTLVLEDRRTMPVRAREIRVAADGDIVAITQTRNEGKVATERFRVFSVAHDVLDDTRVRAGELHDRATIDVSWAVPGYTRTKDSPYLTVGQERGSFWSFFPTKYPTTLSGALNAAWKTNEDRQNLLDSSELNAELLQVAAHLVVDSLGALVEPSDPAAYLPLMPGRAKESPNWACKTLTEHVWRIAVSSPSLPDQDGVLRLPSELRIHREKLSSGALEQWRDYEGRPRNWVHHSVDAPGPRRGKMNHILDAAGCKDAEPVRTWVEALVQDGTAAASAAAIRVLAHLLRHDFLGAGNPVAMDARRACIIRTESGDFVAPIPGSVFRRSGDDGLQDDLVYIDPAVCDEPDMLHLLDELGIRESDAEGRFHSVLDQGFDGYTADSWMRFWELLNTAGGAVQTGEVQRRVSEPAATLHVRTKAGAFVPLKNAMMPGPVVPADGSRDAAFTVDMSFHANDRGILRSLGVLAVPDRRYKPDGDPWFEDYRTAMHDEYCGTLGATDHRIMPKTLRLEGGEVAGPLHLFLRLSEEGRAAFLSAIPDDGLKVNWTRQVGKATASRAQVASPIRWLVQRHGYVQTSQGLRQVAEAVGPQLAEYSEFLPVAKISDEKAKRLLMPISVEQVGAEDWSTLLDGVKASTDDRFVGATYALLLRVAPDLIMEEETVRCRVGECWELRPDNEIALARSRSEYDELVRERHPALLVDRPEDAEQAGAMIEDWGMLPVTNVIEKTIRWAAEGPRIELGDAFPALRQRLGSSRLRGNYLQRCGELEEVIRTPNGTSRKSLGKALEGDTVLIPAEATDEQALLIVDQSFAFGLGAGGCRAVIEAYQRQLADKVNKERVAAVRAAASVSEKLALMLETAELRELLPQSLLDSEERESGEPSRRRLAELAFRSFDDGVLKECSKAIQGRFPGAPSRYDGGPSARRFAIDLGFPDSFAGSSVPAPPERVVAAGPTDFPSLHHYQEVIAGRLVDMLSSRSPQRAMISLPTGAGKTRVAAEGVIRWIRQSGMPSGPILWIAETGELCEQAVQSWKFVWEKVGAEHPLVIDRFWSGNSATAVADRPHLVVATDAMLAAHLDSPGYAWLRTPALVLIDEAHSAISPKYTKLLTKLGLTHRITERHLVGLTATPFRNNEDLTRRLVQRFGDRRLDDDVLGDQPIARLQELEILSRVEHGELPGVQMELEAHELQDLQSSKIKGFLPKSAERRIAEDDVRNKLLVDEIAKLPEDWAVS
ncbi:DEAD/DEAH box helicase [Tomitella fengzijianii]|uniref:DEAD/DEAH box helicase n=1 Tax=Tomitella fengzijianii TaxID=2597660 RepID=A0A516WZS1_9ACTN|nr:DEAD/DEAH box helicase family protein [Tomitella fengzijianii]QDQ96349.1 DEAD/DEAH box helicase [Tomitella fengzijianii]